MVQEEGNHWEDNFSIELGDKKVATMEKVVKKLDSNYLILAFNEFIEGATRADLFDKYGDEAVSNTITSNISTFEDDELIYYDIDKEEYHLTPLGERLAVAFQNIGAVAEHYHETLPLLRHLEGWSNILEYDDLERISRTNITEYTGPQDVGNIKTDYNRFLQGNSSIREILVWDAHDNWEESFLELFTEEGITGELILKRDEIIDQASDEGGWSREYAEQLAANGADLYVYEDDYPGVLFVGDETVAVWGWGPDEDYYDAGVYMGDEIYDWAEDQFKQIKDQSTSEWEAFDWEGGEDDDNDSS